MQNAVFPGSQAIPLSLHQPLRLRYRLVLFSDRTSADLSAWMETQYRQFQEPAQH